MTKFHENSTKIVDFLLVAMFDPCPIFYASLCSYGLDLSCPNRKRLEVSENVKYIAVTSRASKLQVFKVRPGRDLNPGLLRESLNIGKLTHAGGPGSKPGVPQLWRLVTLKPLKLQQCTLHFWKPLIFFYLDKRGQERR